ncbi:unnamed protein product [Hydatigera taeniaeformis]|uniref:WD_REPEATS_REGION domain-containing protein n=1 Tax=Hydatigena taeniaeformis TaxID=6205 RepID=A0A0R3X5B3_HYDTA|nr:unnamed protein product [Hydatigera taeniaeformis]
MFDSVLNEVVTREYQPRNRYTFSRRKCIPLIGVSNLECRKSQAFHLHSSIDIVSPPFDCDFSPRAPNLLLVAKEDGLVHLFDTEQHGSESLLRYYGVHDNAIFSVRWVTRTNYFLTASGDQTIKLVDSETGSVVSVYVGHTMSVRSLALSPSDHYIFASASRDGSIRLWDMRSKSLEGVGCSVHIHGCHLPSVGLSSRRSGSKSRKSMTDSQSVTSVVFAGGFHLVSAGSTDGAIKIWDMRKASSSKKQPQPITSLPYHGMSRKQCGYSDLVLDSDRRRLYASCLDHAVYEYDLTSPSTRPILLYTGHLAGSFYIKLSLSPDNAYLACGSADSRAYIYRVGARTQLPFILSGHSGEVSVPRWSFHDPTCMVTLSDTAQLFVWRMFPAREYTMPETGELIGLTECLSQPTITADHQRSLLASASARSTTASFTTKPSSVPSKSYGDAFDSSSLLARRRRQLNIRDFLMNLPQTNEVSGLHLININSDGSDNTRSSIPSSTTAESNAATGATPQTRRAPLVSGSRIVDLHPPPQSVNAATVAVGTSSSSPPSPSTSSNWDEEDVENNPPSNSSTSTSSHSHHRCLKRHCIHRQLGPPESAEPERKHLPLSDITEALSQSSRKRTMEMDDGNDEEMEDHEGINDSQAPMWRKHSTDFSTPSSVATATGSPRGTPRRRRRTMASTSSSTSTFSLSTPLGFQALLRAMRSLRLALREDESAVVATFLATSFHQAAYVCPTHRILCPLFSSGVKEIIYDWFNFKGVV